MKSIEANSTLSFVKLTTYDSYILRASREIAAHTVSNVVFHVQLFTHYVNKLGLLSPLYCNCSPLHARRKLLAQFSFVLRNLRFSEKKPGRAGPARNVGKTIGRKSCSNRDAFAKRDSGRGSHDDPRPHARVQMKFAQPRSNILRFGFSRIFGNEDAS